MERLLSSDTKLLLPLSLKVLRHKERDTIFLCCLFHLAQSQLSRSASSFNSLTFSKSPKILRVFPVCDVIRTL